MEVHNIVQEAANKTIPKEKKSNKAKWLSEKALQIAEERGEAKSKGETESCIQLKAEFQRKVWRDKKVFFNEQYLKLEENSRRGQTRYVFRKIGNIKGTFGLKMETIKDRNCRDLVDSEENKKRWKEYTELYNKYLNGLDYYYGVVSYPEPDILESELK